MQRDSSSTGKSVWRKYNVVGVGATCFECAEQAAGSVFRNAEHITLCPPCHNTLQAEMEELRSRSVTSEKEEQSFRQIGEGFNDVLARVQRGKHVHINSALALLGVAVAWIQNEVYYQHGFSTTGTALKAVVSVLSVALSINIFRFHAEKRQLLVNIGHLFEGESAWDERGIIRVGLQCSVCLLHCPPGVDITISLPSLEPYGADESPVMVPYSLDSIGAVLVCLRLFVLSASLKEIMLVRDLRCLLAARLSAVDVRSSIFWFKYLIFLYPLSVVFSITIVLILISGFIVRVGEQPASPVFHSWANSFWLAIVTSATVGFGDIFPTTYIGRFGSFMAVIGGMLLINFFTSVFLKWTQPSVVEARFITLLDKQHKLNAMRISAVRFVQAWWRFYTHHGTGPLRWRQRGVLVRIRHDDALLAHSVAQRYGGVAIRSRTPAGGEESHRVFIATETDDVERALMDDLLGEVAVHVITLKAPPAISVRHVRRRRALLRLSKRARHFRRDRAQLWGPTEHPVQTFATHLQSQTIHLLRDLEVDSEQAADSEGRIGALERQAAQLQARIDALAQLQQQSTAALMRALAAAQDALQTVTPQSATQHSRRACPAPLNAAQELALRSHRLERASTVRLRGWKGPQQQETARQSAGEAAPNAWHASAVAERSDVAGANDHGQTQRAMDRDQPPEPLDARGFQHNGERVFRRPFDSGQAQARQWVDYEAEDFDGGVEGSRPGRQGGRSRAGASELQGGPGSRSRRAKGSGQEEVGLRMRGNGGGHRGGQRTDDDSEDGDGELDLDDDPLVSLTDESFPRQRESRHRCTQAEWVDAQLLTIDASPSHRRPPLPELGQHRSSLLPAGSNDGRGQPRLRMFDSEILDSGSSTRRDRVELASESSADHMGSGPDRQQRDIATELESPRGPAGPAAADTGTGSRARLVGHASELIDSRFLAHLEGPLRFALTEKPSASGLGLAGAGPLAVGSASGARPPTDARKASVGPGEGNGQLERTVNAGPGLWPASGLFSPRVLRLPALGGVPHDNDTSAVLAFT